MAPNYPASLSIDPAVGHSGTWSPQDCGFLAWSYDPSLAVNNSAPTVAGTVQIARLKLTTAALVTNVILENTTPGATLTANQNLAGLYQGGALIGTTANQATAWSSGGGLITMALTGGPFAVASGDVIVAFFSNGTTLPIFSRGAGTTSLVNAGTVAASSRYGTADTARTTTLPATLGTITASALSWWAAVS